MNRLRELLNKLFGIKSPSYLCIAACCNYLNVHKPTVIYSDGLVKTSKCKYCGKEITLREDGSWK